MSKYDDLRGVLAQAASAPLAIDERFAARAGAIMGALARGEEVTDSRIAAALSGQTRADPAQPESLSERFGNTVGRKSRDTVQTVPGAQGKLAVVSIAGLINYAVDFFPYATSTRALAATVAELGADDSVKGILLAVDSPGGMVTGLQEAADVLFNVARTKPVGALVDPLSASAALWLSSQASDVAIVPSGEIGSLGVRGAHINIGPSLTQAGIEVRQYAAAKSPRKLEGNPFETPSAETEAYWQREIDACMALFLAAVARGRETTISDVETNYGRGRVLRAPDALRVGLVDRIEMPGAALNRARAGKVLTRAQAEIEKLRAEI